MKLFAGLFVFLGVVFFSLLHQRAVKSSTPVDRSEIERTVFSKKNDTNSEKPSMVSTEQKFAAIKIVTGKTKIDSLIQFAKSLIGTPYKYASTDPSKGFDCSGFINYVFNHFNIKVPRSSRDFRNAGKEIALNNSKPGDLILFTGTDSSQRDIGHIGLIISNKDGISFIHSSSGKADGVVITDLNDYYRSRFVKVERLFFLNN